MLSTHVRRFKHADLCTVYCTSFEGVTHEYPRIRSTRHRYLLRRLWFSVASTPQTEDVHQSPTPNSTTLVGEYLKEECLPEHPRNRSHHTIVRSCSVVFTVPVIRVLEANGIVPKLKMINIFMP
jgi:hypothetical protein